MPLQDLQFVQGCAEHGDAVDFTRRFARYVRSCRMSDYSLLKQVYACAPVCDEVTEAAIEAQIATRAFTYGVPRRDRQFERGAVAADANVNQIDAANQRVGTLTQFSDWFKLTFMRQDAEVEARGTGWARHSLWTSTGCDSAGTVVGKSPKVVQSVHHAMLDKSWYIQACPGAHLWT